MPRYYRILVYEGSEEWIESVKRNNYIKPNKTQLYVAGASVSEVFFDRTSNLYEQNSELLARSYIEGFESGYVVGKSRIAATVINDLDNLIKKTRST